MRYLPFFIVLSIGTDLSAQWSPIHQTQTDNYYNVEFLTPDFGFVMGGNGQLYRTTDGAQNFDTISLPLYFTGDIHFTSPQTGYIAGGTWFSFPPYHGHYLLKTTDGGQTWDSLYAGGSGGIFETIAVPDGNRIFAGGSFQTVQSMDGGVSFIPLTVVSGIQLSVSKFQFTTSDTGYALARQYLHSGKLAFTVAKTVDGGINWQDVLVDTTTPFSSSEGSLVFFNSLEGIAVGTGKYFATTSDGGQSWITDSLPIAGNVSFTTLERNGKAVYAGVSVVADTGSYLYISKDRGHTWNKAVTTKYDYISDISFANKDTGYFITNRLLYRTAHAQSTVITEAANSAFRMWPNPAADRVLIDVDDMENSEHLTITVTNLQGRSLLQETLTDSSLMINLSGWIRGVYLISLHRNGKILQTHKLLLQ